MQDYLRSENLGTLVAKSLFKFRTRMAPFSENFKGQGPPKLCPLCVNHIDSQAMSFQCSKVKEKITINLEMYEDIFKTKIPKELADIVHKILIMRPNEM